MTPGDTVTLKASGRWSQHCGHWQINRRPLLPRGMQLTVVDVPENSLYCIAKDEHGKSYSILQAALKRKRKVKEPT